MVTGDRVNLTKGLFNQSLQKSAKLFLPWPSPVVLPENTVEKEARLKSILRGMFLLQ